LTIPVQERASESNRLQKVLASANLKLAAVASDILGKSGRDMLNALVGGQEDSEVLAALARGRLRGKIPQLQRARDGRVKGHHRFLMAQILSHIDFLDQAITKVYEEVERCLIPFAEAVTLLQTIPCINALAAAVIVAEMGTTMTRFPSAKHLASWAGVCPGNRQSGGKRLSGTATKGDVWLRAVLGEIAVSIARSRGTYLHAQDHRIARRRGKHKAVWAVAQSVIVISYHILRTKQPYQDLGADYFEQLAAPHLERHHVRMLEQLGYTVTLSPKIA
jgi:transposase